MSSGCGFRWIKAYYAWARKLGNVWMIVDREAQEWLRWPVAHTCECVADLRL